MANIRWVNPQATLSRITLRYSGLALTSMPMKDVYDLTKLGSIVVQGTPTTASTKALWERSSRDTTCERATTHNFNWGEGVGALPVDGLGLNWSTSSSKVSLIPYSYNLVLDHKNIHLSATHFQLLL